MNQATWQSLKDLVTNQLSRKRLFVVDGFCGASEHDHLYWSTYCPLVAWQHIL